jgi:hypothetical protein
MVFRNQQLEFEDSHDHGNGQIAKLRPAD